PTPAPSRTPPPSPSCPWSLSPASGRVWTAPASGREIAFTRYPLNGFMGAVFQRDDAAMKITRIRAYSVNLPVKGGRYSWSKGKSVAQVDSTIVRIDTDEGVTGWGEVCPLGSFYLPAFATGARAAIAEMGPHLLGLDPAGLEAVNRAMDTVLKG